MLTIQQLSQELGIGVDTLRVWERRFGFPTPERDARGHRRYAPAQIDHLRVIKKLQNLGHRPKKLFALSSAERLALLNQQADLQQHNSGHQDLQYLVNTVAAAQLEHELRTRLQKRGTEAFVLAVAVPLIEVMDRGWLSGTLSIAREHLLSDCLTAILKELLVPREAAPKIVFLTLSGERHKLGLLLSAVLFHSWGLDCHLVLEELPVAEVTTMVEFFAADAVALSFSVQTAPRQAKRDLATLRKTLPNHVHIIAGGSALRDGLHLPGISVCTDLRQIRPLCAREFPNLNQEKKAE
ncbi:MAG: MerR family transcriptional regulator [Desulfuromonadales bacterium]|nr:MerR family transcriptional regulator [Desulfuromonadales bacterium]